MAIFSMKGNPIKRNLFINEVEIGGQEIGEDGRPVTDEDAANEETSAETNNETNDDAAQANPDSTDDNTTETNEPAEGQEEAGAGDSDEGEPTGEDEGTQPPEDETAEGETEENVTDEGNEEAGAEGEETPTDDTATNPSSEYDKEIFDNLSDEEMSSKNKKLKQNYIDLYDIVCDFLDKINDNNGKDTEEIKVLEFIYNKLTELKTMIVDYMSDVFNSKSYIENTIYYNYCLAVVAGMNKILTEMINEDKE